MSDKAFEEWKRQTAYLVTMSDMEKHEHAWHASREQTVKELKDVFGAIEFFMEWSPDSSAKAIQHDIWQQLYFAQKKVDEIKREFGVKE